MSLIKCPECSKEISDKSEHCIYCGYPLQAERNKELYSLILDGLITNGTYERAGDMASAARFIQQLLKIGLRESVDMLKHTPQMIADGISADNIDYIKTEFLNVGCIVRFEKSICTSPHHINDIISRRRNGLEELLECPRCHSNAITTGERGYSLLTGFIGSNKTVNRCGKCGYSWKV